MGMEEGQQKSTKQQKWWQKNWGEEAKMEK